MLEVIFRTATGIRALRPILSTAESLHAPHLLDLEVVQVLRRYLRAGIIDEERATQALEDFSSFSIQRYPHDLFLPRIWELRQNLTAYDAAYIALAEALGATLLTCDKALARTPGHHANIQLPLGRRLPVSLRPIRGLRKMTAVRQVFANAMRECTARPRARRSTNYRAAPRQSADVRPYRFFGSIP